MTEPLLIAHRGTRAHGAAENTIRAFRDAIAEGADGVELDVRGTADDRLVVVHDPVVTLADGRRARVRATRLEDLRDSTLESHDRIPPLEEALRALLARTGVVIEVKEADLGARVAAAITSLKADKRLQWLLVASSHPDVLLEVGRSLPGVRRALVVARSGFGWKTTLRSLLPVGAMRRAGAQDLLPHHSLVTPPLVERIANAGGRVLPWTVNDARTADRLAADGVHGLITDDLAPLRAALR